MTGRGRQVILLTGEMIAYERVASVQVSPDLAVTPAPTMGRC